MQLFDAILVIFSRLTIILGRRSVYQRQELVRARLQNISRIRMQPDVSEAWNERRIIRSRLEAYASK